MKRFTTLLVLCLFASPAFSQEKKVADITVPFDTIRTRHMIVDVMVNGKGPFTLIFDTGAPVSIISNKLAKEAKLKAAPGGLGMFAALIGIGQQRIDALEIGGAKLDQVDAIVMDHPTITAIASFADKKIDGIVGFNVFGRFTTTIDYEKKTMTLAASDFRPTNMIDSLTKMLAAKDRRAPVLAPQGMLGLTVNKKSGDEAAGVTVESVFAGSPAAKAGVKVGDRLLTLDGRWTESVNDCFEAARTLRAGDSIALEVVRDGKTQSLKAIVAAGF